MRKMLPNDVSSTELALLNHSFRADGDDGCNKRPLRLLSLGASDHIHMLQDAHALVIDGGGVRGVSELQILKVLFGNNGEVKPYKYFDMICGTSTGGYVIRSLTIIRF
jgi:predicted acylesterase/phospholipase RssA